jgi:hypothetical protein
MTCKEIAELAAAVATVAGVFVALWAGWIALLTFRGQTRQVADAHAHGVIREMLLVAMDRGRDRSGVRTFKLYALEEVFDWLTEQQEDARRWPWSWLMRDRNARLKELACWRETLKTHLEAYMRPRVNSADECYGQAFRDFVNAYAPGPKVRR